MLKKKHQKVYTCRAQLVHVIYFRSLVLGMLTITQGDKEVWRKKAFKFACTKLAEYHNRYSILKYITKRNKHYNTATLIKY